jgi:hypothetical protein
MGIYYFTFEIHIVALNVLVWQFTMKFCITDASSSILNSFISKFMYDFM